MDRIREVSIIVAREVIREAQRQKLDREPALRNLDNEELDIYIKESMYDPRKDNRVVENQSGHLRSPHTPRVTRSPGGKSLL